MTGAKGNLCLWFSTKLANFFMHQDSGFKIRIGIEKRKSANRNSRKKCELGEPYIDGLYVVTTNRNLMSGKVKKVRTYVWSEKRRKNPLKHFLRKIIEKLSQ